VIWTISRFNKTINK